MSADQYRKFACDKLGLGFDDADAVTTNPRHLYHNLGSFRIIDTETVGVKVANARLSRVIDYAKYTKSQYFTPVYDDMPYEESMRIAEQRDQAQKEWEDSYLPHLFMSFADYKLACRASANPPSNPHREAEDFETRAIMNFRHNFFKRHQHTPDWTGYTTYLRQRAKALYDLMAKPLPAWFPEHDRLTHSYVIGTTGSGKSELLKLMAHSYSRVPEYSSVVLLDPKGDLAEQVGRWKENADSDRLIYVDPFLHPDFTPTINPFDAKIDNEQQKRLVAQELFNAISEILKSEGGADFSLNMQSLLMPCLLVLLDYPNASLQDLHRFMINETNSDLLQFAVSSRDDGIKSFFQYEFGARSYQITKHAIASKLSLLLSTGTFADLTCGPSTIDLESAMADRKLIVFNLSKGSLGENESRAFGKLIVALIQSIAQRRTTLPAAKRVPAHVIIDECQNYVTRSIGTILDEARAMKVYLTLAQLSVGAGMDDELERTVLGMTNVKIIGRCEVTEERKTSGLLGVDPADMATLDIGQFFARSGRNPTFKFQSRTDLLDNSNAMSLNDWNQVRGEQIEKYYRCKTDVVPPPDVPTYRSSDDPPTNPSTGDKPKRKLI